MASNILPLFWNLASSSKDARLGASVELISTLEGFQQNHQPREPESGDEDDEEEDDLARDNAEDVAYSVKRLIRGLASSRESSRFGFSVALTEVSNRRAPLTSYCTVSRRFRPHRRSR
jgi:DNA polymerase phi